MKTMAFIFLISLGLVLAGCAKEITLDKGGEAVQLMDKLDDPSACKETSTHTVTAQSSWQLQGSSEEREEKDRLVTARNAAAKKGANVIVPQGALEGKSRVYKAFKCN